MFSGIRIESHDNTTEEAVTGLLHRALETLGADGQVFTVDNGKTTSEKRDGVTKYIPLVYDHFYLSLQLLFLAMIEDKPLLVLVAGCGA